MQLELQVLKALRALLDLKEPKVHKVLKASRVR